MVDLIEYAIIRCPPGPLDAVNSAVVRIISNVLSAQRKDTSFSFWTTCFQQRFSVRLAEIVMHSPADKEQVCACAQFIHVFLHPYACVHVCVYYVIGTSIILVCMCVPLQKPGIVTKWK